MPLQSKYSRLENYCSNPLTVDPNPPLDLNCFSLILGLENTDSDRKYNYLFCQNKLYKLLIGLNAISPCKAVYAGSIPTPASILMRNIRRHRSRPAQGMAHAGAMNSFVCQSSMVDSAQHSH